MGTSSDSKQVKIIGANVRKLRAARGLTQEKLAELAELHHRSIQKLESGEMNVLITTMCRLRAALQCSWEDLLGR